MTAKDRLDRALVIQNALYQLMTTEEADTYEDVIHGHLNDYIGDLKQDYAKTLGTDL